MALQRFRESFRAGPEIQIQRIPLTQELREKYHIDALSTRLKESNSKLVLKDKILYKFPIAKINHPDKPNANGRIYTRKLWENVINNQKHVWQNSIGLADHPPDDSDGEFKYGAVVWHDMSIDDTNDIIWGVGSLVGDYGQLAQDIIDVGGRIGFSSSGFGELLYDGKTVNPDTYQIERCADIVLNPSQQVYGNASNALNVEYDDNKPVRSPYSDDDDVDLFESNRKKEKKIEEKRMNSGISKLEEKKFRRDIEMLLRDASKITDPKERLQELTDILSYFEEGAAPDLREKVEAQILEEKQALEKLIEEAKKTQEAFGVTDTDELKTGVALLAEEVKVALAEAKDWESIAKALVESNQKYKEALTVAEAKLNARPTVKAMKELKDKITFLQEQRKKLIKNFALKEKSLQRKSIVQAKQINKLLHENQQMKSTTALLENKIKRYAEQLQKTVIVVGKNGQKITQMNRLIKGLKEKLKEKDSEIQLMEGRNARLSEKLVTAEKLLEQTKNEFQAFKKKIEEDSKPKILPRFEERTSGYFNFNEGKGEIVEAFWADLVGRHGDSILPYERHIRGCKTYKEAMSAYLKVLPGLDEHAIAAEKARLPETSAMTKAERKKMLEEAGMNLSSQKELKLPDGWQ